MKTRKFIDVLKAVCAHRDHAFSADYFASRPDAAQFVNDHLRTAWHFAWWRDLLVIEKRHYRPVYDATRTYTDGQEVWFSVAGVVTYFRSMVTDNLGVTPGTDETKWKAVEKITDSDLPNYEFETRIALNPASADADGGSAIGEKVWKVCADDPRKDPAGAVSVDFVQTGSDLWVRGSVPAEPWVIYLPPCPVFSTGVWNSQPAAKDDLVYSADRGECYRSLEDSNSDTPGESLKWEKVLFPAVLFAYVTRKAYCDWYRAGQISGQDAESKRRAVNDVDAAADDRLGEDAAIHAER